MTLDVAPKASSWNLYGETLEVEGCRISSGPDSTFDNPVDTWTAYLRPNPLSSTTIPLDTVPNVGLYHAWQTCTKTLGPLRLGVTYEYSTTQDRWRLRYALFADANTHERVVFAGHPLSDGTPYSVPTEVGMGDRLTFFVHPSGGFMPQPSSDEYVVRVGNATANGAPVSITQIYAPFILTGTEVAESRLWNFGPFAGWGFSFGAPLLWNHDVDVRDAGGNQTSVTAALSVIGALGSVAQSYAVTSPSVGSHSVPNTDWDRFADAPDGRITAAITAYPKSAPTDPDLSAADMRLRFSHTKPKTPASAPESWQPLAVTLLAPNPVLRSTHAWTGSGPISISGSAFTVSGGGATASRTLNSNWRAWNTPGDPSYHADDHFTTTKADYYGDGNQDGWGWSLYRYLDWTMTGSVAATLTLAVTFAVVPPSGGASFSVTRSYTAAFPSGSSTQRLDLLFPDEADSAPCYIERVDAIQFSGFAAGSYTVGALVLAAAAPARVKVAARGGWSGLVVTQDGSFPASQWGDDPAIDLTATPVVHRKADEDGLMRTDSGDDYYGGCVRVDGTLAATCAEWDRMEGVTCAYDGAVMAADLTDGDGNRIGFVDGAAVPAVPQAAWLHAQLPAISVPQNTLTHLPASLRFDTLALCPMPTGTFTAVVRGHLGMVLEAVVLTDEGKPAPAGRQVQAKRQVGGAPAASDPVLGSGTTDASGAVEVPIRTGTYGGAEGTVYLEGA